ncbi:MAG: hypothetical protein K6A65_05925, partial [Succinivibrionaceae bacterium]|nr:hypothetical protein [Succinivibrionaceae bacterium]
MIQEKLPRAIAAGIINPIPLDLGGNLSLILREAKRAAAEGRQMIFFPELSLCGCGCQDMFLAAGFLSRCEAALLTLMRELPGGLLTGVGLPLLGSDGGVYDCYALLLGGQLIGVEAMRDFPAGPRDFRAATLTPAGGRQITLSVGGRRVTPRALHEVGEVSVAVALDEGALPAQGCDLLVLPRAERFEPLSHVAREAFSCTLSKHLGCCVLRTNLVGCESGEDIFDGLALIATGGSIVAASPLLSFRRSATLALGDGVAGRPEGDELITRAVGLGIFDWVVKTRSRGVVVSLSGGADSALCAVAATAG